MNPLILVAALAAVPLHASPAPPNRAVVFQLRVLTYRGGPAYPLGTYLTYEQLRAVLTEVESHCSDGVLLMPRLTAAEGQTAKVFLGHTRTFTTGVQAVAKNGGVEVVPTTKTVEVGSRFELSGRAAARGAVAVRVKYTDTRVGEVVRGAAVNVRHVGADGLERNGVVTIEAPEVDTVTAQAEVRVPAGRSVVIRGPAREQEVRETYGIRVLSRIPDLSRQASEGDGLLDHYRSRQFTTVGSRTVKFETYLVLSATVVEDEPARPVAPAPRPVRR